MKTSLTWLNEYLNNAINLDEQAVADLAERIERTSVEIDSSATLAGKQDGLVVAEVVQVTSHPDSDHMVIAKLNIGENDLTQVVTGAPNIEVGQLVILAKVGAHIINHESGELMVIQAANLRGETSQGMVVALQEIGFDSKIAPKAFEAGIHIFNKNDGVHPGDDALEVLGMNEPVLDTDLTPNRADMLSMAGNAYEFGAILNQSVTTPSFELVEYDTPADKQISIKIDDAKLAPKYALRVVNNVKVTDSPLWLQKHLWNAGIRPINNVVDVTNYMMLTYGQPLHAFDLDKINDSKINVRLARDGEQLTTLDKQTRDLRSGEDIVIASGDEVLMLAGVMGGQSFEIDEQTTNIAIEAAVFNPSLVRATARRHNIHSEASARFERGVNWDATFETLDHAASLIDQLTDGQIAYGQIKAADEARQDIVLSLTVIRVNEILGTSLGLQDLIAIFDRLAFNYQVADDKLIITVPARRPDITIEADLIEEVARLFGYDNLPVTLPYGPTTPGKLTVRQRQIRASRHIMETLGLNQAISYALTTPEKAKQFVENTDDKVVTLDYPMSSDRTTLRQNLLAGLLEDVVYNVNHFVHDIALYEQGRIFVANGDNELPTETEHIAGVLTGNRATSDWQEHKAARAVDFYDIKGVTESYLSQIGVENIRYVATERHDNMHPGQTADIYTGEHYLGFVGQIHPKITKFQKLAPIFAFELNLFAIMANITDHTQYSKISRFPQMSRDAALLVDETITHAEIEAVIRQSAGDKLVNITIFDVYEGNKLPEGKKSLAYTLVYQDNDETLVESAVNDDFKRVTEALVSRLNVEIR